MKKNIIRYFSNTAVARFLRIAAVFITLIGVLVICFAYGFGPLGVPVIAVGITLFFVCDSRIVKDKTYDDYMRELINTDSNSEHPDYSFESYSGINAAYRKVVSGAVRTDRLVRTEITVSDDLLCIVSTEACADGNRTVSEKKFRLGSVRASTTEENGANYISLSSDEAENYLIPVPKNDYNVEEFCVFVNKFVGK